LAGSFATAGGTTTLIGWALDVPRLSDWDGNGISMKTNAALCAAGAGAAVLALAPRTVTAARIMGIRFLAATAASIGFITLLEHTVGWNAGIDTLLFTESVGARATAAPNRMGPPASLSFTLIGVALGLLTVRSSARRAALVLGGLTLALSSFSLIGYAYGAPELFSVDTLTGIAPQTGLMIHGLGWAIVALAIDRGGATLILGDGPGGAMMRRLGPLAVAVPLVLGLGALTAHAAGLASVPLATASVALGTALFLLTFVIRTARHIEDTGAALVQSEARYRTAFEEAERAARAKDDFIATVSHELRAPLNSVLGWSHLLKGESLDARTRREAAEAIDRGVRAQTRLIDDLLDVSGIMAGKLRLDVQSVNLVQVIDATLEAVRPAAEAKDLTVHAMLDPHAGALTGDPNRLQQVVWNLLANAAKFTPKGGRIEVHLQRVDSHIELRVSDTGDGIAAADLPRVFERFHQADSSITRRHGGLGLGLTIVKHLVELHGGTVTATSAGPGLGSTFSVRLPVPIVRLDDGERRHPSTPGTDASLASSDELAGVRVLVVDDDADSVALMQQVLAAHGASVETATSARQALGILDRAPIDVLLSDLGMPEVDGYELIRRSRRRRTNLRACAVTAFARPEDRIRALRAGYDMHMAKPVEPREIIAVVASLAHRPMAAH
jgi:signal transduction histidine kinase/ActR/RegA family two-component response regulator